MSSIGKLRVVLIGALSLISSQRLHGSAKYLALEPGISTKADAERVLGKPLQALGATLSEHAPQDGTGPIYVEVRSAADPVIDRIEVGLIDALDGALIREALKLPPKPTAAIVNAGQRLLVEYYGDRTSIVLTFKSSQPSSGVVSVGYLSDRLFDAELARAANAPPPSAPASTPRAPAPPASREPSPPLPTPVEPPPGTVAAPKAGPSVVPPSIRRDPLVCYDLYQWSIQEEEAARKARDVARRQKAMEIRISSQSGDCERGRALVEAYRKLYGR